jgi:protein disulfide-isomerase A6
MKAFALLASLYTFCMAEEEAAPLYGERTPVVQLTTDTFKELVLDSNDMWMIEFYAPWCGHCKALAPEWEAAAHALDGVIKVGAVDMTQHESVGKPYEVSGFPTLKFFGADKTEP